MDDIEDLGKGEDDFQRQSLPVVKIRAPRVRKAEEGGCGMIL
jgi:hypothetical protein